MLQTSIEHNLMRSLVSAEFPTTVVHHFSQAFQQLGCSSLLIAKFNVWNKTFTEITPVATTTATTDIKYTSWSETTSLTLHDLCERFKANVEEKTEETDDSTTTTTSTTTSFTNNQRIQFDHDQHTVVVLPLPLPLPLPFSSNSTSQSPALPLPQTPLLGLLCYLVPTKKGEAMEKMEDFFIDLSSRSLVRTLKRDVLQQRSDILERIENNDKLNVGLLGCDLDGQVVHYNQSLTNMVGWVRGSSRAASSFFIFFNNFF